MDFKKTEIRFWRPVSSYSKVQHFVAHVIRNHRFHIDSALIQKKDYLDLGCGSNIHDSFVNLDYSWRPGIDVCWDVTKGIPLTSQSVKGVFSEHCLEHLPFTSIRYVLSECFRVLQKGGTLRIIVPDGELYLTKYTDIIRGQTATNLPYSQNDAVEGLYGPIMSVNRIFREHGHLFIYDFDILNKLLVRQGFTSVKKESFMSGRDDRLLIDSEHRAIESLYVEATKP